MLEASSDTGTSPTDGITKDATPTLTGTATESGGQIEVYDGTTLLGKADVGTDRSWTFTPGTDKALTDGVHTVTVRQVDAAGNRSDASAGLAITVDTTAPTITGTQSTTQAGSNRYALTFSEQIKFVDGGIVNVLDSDNVGRSHHAWNVLTNWTIDSGNTLALNLGTLNGAYHLTVDGNAIQDLAGNVAIVGSTPFTVGMS